ncbi:hypothetical protein K7X08_037198 [Anisodus acutangulus]|uniref:Uncharacterized protein n=1 Tax=Anisodus acutangulus TaxID=402998 RepID=A0A9Q1QTE5_9SOLA|nr:hypothetical protein K7X08_037198 [Anisodus acutangulus]
MLSLESDQLRNIFPTDDERMVLDLEGLTFETATEASQSQRMSDEFLYTQVLKGDMATITQAAKVGASSTKGEDDEQATKDATLETINVNAGVNDQAREDGLPQGGDIVAEGIPPPPEDDIMRPHAGQVAEDIVRAESDPVAEEVPANATGGVKDSEVYRVSCSKTDPGCNRHPML